MPDSLLTKSGDVTATIAPQRIDGCEGRESEEEYLRRVLGELDRQALECMLERIQRSICFLLETRKEKQAEQLALLRERRRLDAMLADAQKQLVQYGVLKLGSTGEAVTASSFVESRNWSATSDSGRVEPSLLSISSTSVTAAASQLQVVGGGGNMCEETISADKEYAVTSLRLHPLPPLQGGRDGTESARCSQRQQTASPGSVSEEAEEEGYENILADFLGDLLHKYGPAAVKGVGAAAHIVKEGLGVLRQELLDLQQHQQATERQRAIEKRAKYMLRRQEELERLRHQHLMQQLHRQHVFAGGIRPPYLESSSLRTAAPAAGSAAAGKVHVSVALPSAVCAASLGQESQQRDGGKSTSSQATTSVADDISSRAMRECAPTADGEKSLCCVERVMHPETCIRATGEYRPAGALGTKACDSKDLPLHAENPQQVCENSVLQDGELQKQANKVVKSLNPRTGVPETAAVHVIPNLTNASEQTRGHQHGGAHPRTNKDDCDNSGDVCTSASAKTAASSSWKEFFAVEGKSSPPPHEFVEYGVEVEKSNNETGVLMNGSTNAWNSLRCDGQGGSLHSDRPSNRRVVYTNARPLLPVSSALPSSYRTLGTRKERLQRTAASLDSFSRGVADAVGSVKHTIARWFYISGEPTTASIEKRALTHENAVSDSGDAIGNCGVACVKEKKPSRIESSFLDVREVEIHVENTSDASSSHAPLDTTPVAERSLQESQQRSKVDPSMSSGGNGDLGGRRTLYTASTLEAISDSNATTRNSGVFRVTQHLADGDATDGAFGIADETAFVTEERKCSTEAAREKYVVERVLQTENKVRESEHGDCKGGRASVLRNSSAAHQGSGDEVRTAPKPSIGGRQDVATSRVSCTAGSVVRGEAVRTFTVAEKAEPARRGNISPLLDPNGGGRDELSVPADGNEGSNFLDSGSGYEEQRANEREFSSNEEDPPVIEASIRVGRKNGMVALPLVVLATEQCRDVAEEWVDQHWVQLQQTHFWLMRGKSGASEAAAAVGPIGTSASGSGSCALTASGKRNNETQISEHEDEKGMTGRHVCGSGAVKTTFLTRSRAIHSLAAFLRHAEATSENLPVRIVEDWEKIITSPSAETTRELTQHTRQKNFDEACNTRK